MNEVVKGGLPVVVVFEYGGCVENLLAHVVDIIGDSFFGGSFRACRAVVHDKLGYHAKVLVQGVVFLGQGFEVEGRFARQDVTDLSHFSCKSAGENEQAHNLDYAD